MSAADEQKTPEQRAAAVDKIVAECIDIRKDCGADRYLQSRGITAIAPDSIKCRPHAHGKYGSLVALATDAEGSVWATYEVYLNKNGTRPSPSKVFNTPKRTHAREGWLGKAVARLPGKKPITLCEGPETALSVWQATGHETWVCGGSKNFQHAPIADGESVLIARDGDEPGSAADKDIDAAIRALQKRRITVGIATPPQGMDFNDVLMQRGGSAVADLIYESAIAEPRNAPEVEQQSASADAGRAFEPVALTPFGKSDVRPTPWVVHGLLLRGANTVVAAAGGTGKTQLTIQAAVAWAKGDVFLGWTPMRPLRIAFVSGEEPLDELRRRIAAAIISDGGDFDEQMQKLNDRLFTFATKDVALVEKVGADGSQKIRRTPFHAALLKLCKERAIDVVIIDPTIRAHSGLDENSAEMQELHNAADAIATQANCSVMLVHHIRKSSHGDVDSAAGVRGASALVDASRVTLMLSNMTAEEAKDLLPPEHQARFTDYVKFRDPKQNYAQSSAVRWLQKESVTLPILLEDGTNDCRMVLRPWSPGQADVLAAAWVGKFLDDVDNAVRAGRPLGAGSNGPRASRADALLEDKHGLSKKGAREALKRLVDEGMLAEERSRDLGSKRERQVYVVQSRTPLSQEGIPF